jgi:GNAT superfamily N-acetyltransferase
MNDAPLPIRPGVPEDAENMASVIAEGFAIYRAFGPPGWKPPADVTNPDVLRQRLRDEQTWIAVAPDGDDLAGLVGATSARRSRPGSDAPDDLAHLWLCFVRTRYHGTGLASRLLEWGVQAARDHGYTHMRLFAAAGQSRARRFYEREGWEATDDTRASELGPTEIRYRCRL